MTQFDGITEDGGPASHADLKTADPKKADPKRAMWLIGGLWTFSLPTLTIALFFASGRQSWVLLALPIYVFLLMPLIDSLVGEDLSNPPEEAVPALSADKYYMRVARALVIAGYVSMIGGIAFLSTQTLPLWSMIGFLFGLGIVNATFINLAHELGHKADPVDRFFAKLALGAIGYGHFTADHNLGHHKNVATPEDHASGRLGESVYGFAVRELPGALIGGWKIEANKLRRRGLKVWSRHNEILQADAITLVVAIALVGVLGWKALPFIIAHHFLAFFGLTMVNYIEHYGLKRQKLPNGRYEPTQPHHSWNTNHVISNVMQIHLQRHSDHHTHPMRPYQALRNYEELPRLPSGYPGCLTLAAIPPLWFYVMNPKVKAWASGDLSKTNIHEPARARLSRQWAQTEAA